MTKRTTPYSDIEPEQHPLWPVFVEYADDKGISLESEDDWFEWWECFLAGVAAEHKHLRG